MKKKVEIVGSGPAGLTAAINLARAGFKVTVYEKNQDVGNRFHGDFQGIENWSTEENVLIFLERIGLSLRDAGLICRPYSAITAFDSGLNPTVMRSGEPFFYLVMRGGGSGSLDRWLLNTALEAGAEVIFNKRVDKLEDGGIVAIGPMAADAIAKGIVFDTDMEDIAAAILDDRIAPKGYAYLLVNEGRATLATCMFKEFKREGECFEASKEAFRKAFPRLQIKGEKEFGGYGNFFFGKPAYENGRCYAGESAGLQDCLWGFGLRYAMVSGYLAAKSIIEGREYASLVKKELLPWQRTSLVNRFLFERLGNRGYAYVINVLGRRDAVGEIRRQYAGPFWKRVMYPLARWNYRSRLIDRGCHGEDCACVWCRCGKGEAC